MLQKRLISLSCVATYSSLHQCDSVNKTASLWRLENCSTLALSDVEHRTTFMFTGKCARKLKIENARLGHIHVLCDKAC